MIKSLQFLHFPIPIRVVDKLLLHEHRQSMSKRIRVDTCVGGSGGVVKRPKKVVFVSRKYSYIAKIWGCKISERNATTPAVEFFCRKILKILRLQLRGFPVAASSFKHTLAGRRHGYHFHFSIFLTQFTTVPYCTSP